MNKVTYKLNFPALSDRLLYNDWIIIERDRSRLLGQVHKTLAEVMDLEPYTITIKSKVGPVSEISATLEEDGDENFLESLLPDWHLDSVNLVSERIGIEIVATRYMTHIRNSDNQWYTSSVKITLEGEKSEDLLLAKRTPDQYLLGKGPLKKQ